MRRLLPVAALTAVAVPALLSIAQQPAKPGKPDIKPQIQNADRNNTGVVFLERADELYKHRTDSFMIVNGNVEFRRMGMFMYCDSAHYWPGEQRFRAFGNVRMQQGDTLFVYADSLDYDDRIKLATLFAEPPRKVTMINRDVKLETDFTFYYDLANELGWYNQFGVLTDPSNRLESVSGEYSPPTKDAVFTDGVVLNAHSSTDTLVIRSQALYYNTDTKIAELYTPSEIINRRGTIFTDSAIYNTGTDNCQLYDRSTVVTPEGRFLTADTLYYTKQMAEYTAYGSMILTDTVRKMQLLGDYGYYNEERDSTYLTGHALMKEYSKGDTLFMHGRQIEGFVKIDSIVTPADTVAGTAESVRIDSTHVSVVYPRVRFYRSDMQGICDSLRVTEADSTMRMFVSPVVWSEDRQISGRVIAVHFNDSTYDRVNIPEQAFTADHIEDQHYNQISGKEMVAHFVDGNLKHLDINGSVELILYPEEQDSTINKIVNAQSSFLRADFAGRTTERIKMWPETTGTVTPLFLAKRSLFFLPKFRWYTGMRPASPADVMIIPKEMDELIEQTRSTEGK